MSTEDPTVVDLQKQLTNRERAILETTRIVQKLADAPITIEWKEGEHGLPCSYTYPHRPPGWIQPGFRELFGSTYAARRAARR